MAYDALSKVAAKKHTAAIRAKTFCANCGKQPIEWHNPEHDAKPNRRVAQLVALGFPIAVIDAEIERCEALCRSCHMKEDGRLAALHANKPHQKGTSFPPKPCSVCGTPSKPLRIGKCRHCYDEARPGTR